MEGMDHSRRRFLTGSGAWLGAAALGLGREGGGDRLRTVSIFHTTDLHGHILPTVTYGGLPDVGGFARCVSCLRGWRQENPHSLLVDLGDVYQGTAESFVNKGRLMIGLFNRIGYDAWALGNHDFDWGPEALEENLALSQAPVLTANIARGGRNPGNFEGKWAKVRPWAMREVGGFKIALIGLVTPGLPYWLTPETLGGVVPLDPAGVLKQCVAEAKAEKADAIVAMGHMGFRARDDFANPLQAILRAAPGVDVFLAGHTHQHQPAWDSQGVLCSQAGYHGIHCGRVDLTFDLETRRLVERQAVTVLMDKQYELDPAVMELAAPELKTAEEQMARKVATVVEMVPGKGRDSRLVRLLCETFAEALVAAGHPVDGVFHGTFGTGDLEAGLLTVADCWKLLPYENLLVTARLSAADLIEIVREDARSRSDRSLWPFKLVLDGDGTPSEFLHRGEAVAADRVFTIAFNSYDAQSGGQQLMRLREILERPEARRTVTSIETRSALIDGFLARGEIR
jgi:5'-nucleotidase / UDP-sugar diphosphatase